MCWFLMVWVFAWQCITFSLCHCIWWIYWEMCIFAIFLRRYLVKTVVKSKRRYLLIRQCDFFLVFTKRSSDGSSFWWTPWFMVEIFFWNNTSLVRCDELLHFEKKCVKNKFCQAAADIVQAPAQGKSSHLDV